MTALVPRNIGSGVGSYERAAGKGSADGQRGDFIEEEIKELRAILQEKVSKHQR